MNKHEPVYQAIWAETTGFDEVLISAKMFKDHMPDKVLEALNKVIFFRVFRFILCRFNVCDHFCVWLAVVTISVVEFSVWLE